MTEVTSQDLIKHAVDQKPLEFASAFKEILQGRLNDAIDSKKLEIAKDVFNQNSIELEEPTEKTEE